MGLIVRFSPLQCPVCDAPVAARYSQYRHASRHPLFGVLLVAGVIAIIVISLLSLWGAAILTAWAVDGQWLRRKERGMIYFLAFAATLPVIVWLSRLWWRAIHRLPRQFEYECEACRWVGPCLVSESHDQV